MFKKKRFWLIVTGVVLLIGGAVVWWWYAFHAGGGPPIFTISKDTTYVTGPVLPSGHIDYVTALNERMSNGVTPENNAQVLLVKAIGPRPLRSRFSPGYYKWLGISEPPANGEYFVDFRYYLGRHLKITGEKLEELFKTLYLVGNRPCKPSDYPQVAKWLETNEKPLAVAIEATKRPKYYKPMIPGGWNGTGLMHTLLPEVSVYRELAETMVVRAMFHTHEGRYQEAWLDLLAAHRLGRNVFSGPTLIESLVGISIDLTATSADLAYLDHGKLSARKIKACLNDLNKLPPAINIADTINRGDRIITLDAVMMADRFGPESLGPKKKGSSAFFSPLTGKVNWDPALRKINCLYDRLVAACRNVNRKFREKEFTAIELEIAAGKVTATDSGLLQRAFMTRHERGKRIGDVMIEMLLGAHRKLKDAEDRLIQAQRNLHIAFALAAYSSDHNRYPDNLEQLQPNYLKKISNDLFTGKPLVYRPTKEGYLLYSFGPNGEDDGGRDIEEAPSAYDIVVRMPVQLKANLAN